MSERTIFDNRGAVEISTIEPFTCSELFDMSEQLISQNPPDQTSEPNHPEPTQALVFMKNLLLKPWMNALTFLKLRL